VEGPHVIRAVALLVCGACAARAPTAAPPTVAAAPAAPAASVSSSCAAPEFRQLDFWIGDWDVTVHARASPTSEQWGEAEGRQHVEAILGGCAIAEHFTAAGPPTRWSGASYSMWQPQLGAWRQTWVDDSGSFLAFRGGFERDNFVLYGEPKTADGTQTQKRMVFSAITPTSLHWEWQQTSDGWTTVVPMIKIDYRRVEAKVAIRR
jgi:hypothetical protein